MYFLYYNIYRKNMLRVSPPTKFQSALVGGALPSIANDIDKSLELDMLCDDLSCHSDSNISRCP